MFDGLLAVLSVKVFGWSSLDSIELYMSRLFACIVSTCMNEPVTSLEGHFASPQSGLVEVTETVHHNWNWESDGEDTKEGCDATNELAKSRNWCGCT